MPRIHTLILLYALFLSSGRSELVINEFLSSNSGGLRDEDGNAPDWIEIHNPDAQPVSLEGYFLTDDAADLMKWRAPAVQLEPSRYFIIFASGKDRNDPNQPLHTNFKLGESGYLALVAPDGETVISDFGEAYPDQFENVSYGVAQTGSKITTNAVRSSTSARVIVPTSDIGTQWRSLSFNDQSWSSAITGVGYERGNGYGSLLGQGGDLEGQLFDQRTSLYLRIPFQVNDLSNLSEITLRMKYDDGFIAWINGVQVASANAPSTPRWDSSATGLNDDSAAVVFERFDASAAIPALRNGENVLAIQGLNVNSDSSDFVIMPELDTSRSTDVITGETGYLETPSPGALNGPSFGGFVQDTKFTVDRGFYTEAFEVEISSATEDAVIRYTTNGDEPTATSGTRYSEPVRIARTTTLRAAAFKEGMVSTNVDTVTYLFLNDVVRQSPNNQVPSGWPGDRAVSNQRMDYGMDPDIVNSEDVVGALQAVPTLSVVTELENLFDSSRGIYVNAGGDGSGWERPASLELLHPDGSKGFQIDFGLRIRGGFSRTDNNPKHSFRFLFKRQYGEGKLRFPMFGDEGADAFDNIDLRTSQNYSWAFGGDSRNTMLRDVFSRDTQGEMGRPYTRSRYYHLYLNGIYWGLYQTQERAEASFAKTYMGGDKSDFDVIKSFGSVTDGDRAAHNRLWEEASAGFSSDARYFRVQGLNTNGTPNATYERLLDVDNVIDYMIITYYTGDRDGPGSRFTQPNPNNFYAIYNRTTPDGFKYFEHDSEHSLGTGDNDMTFPLTSGSSQNQFNPHWLHERLVANAHYRQRFADAVQQHLFNNGVLDPDNAVARVERRASQIDQAIIAESARWGDAQGSTPFRRSHWMSATEDLKRWIRSRRETVMSQLRARGWIPAVGAPEFQPNPGAVPLGTEIRFEASSGQIYYTLDGSDPRDPNGNVASAALEAEPSGKQITVLQREGAAASAFVPSNNTLGTRWRDLNFTPNGWINGAGAVGYDENNGYRGLINLDVNQAMNDVNTSVYVRVPFTVPDPGAFSELTLKMKYDDGFAAFLNGVRVASANSPSTLTWNADATGGHADGEATTFQSFDITPQRFALRVGANVLAIHGFNDGLGSSDMLISPQLEGSITAGGTAARLPDGRVLVRARARLGNEWSGISEGAYLVGIDRASSSNIVVSEIMYHPAKRTDEEKAAGYARSDFEYIELLNIGSHPVDLTGLNFLRGFTYSFDEGAMLASGQRGVLVSNRAGFAERYGEDINILGEYEGALDDSGERVALVRRWDDPIQDIRYNDKGDWPAGADGSGRSLILVNAESNPDPNAPTNWLASENPNGSPGAFDPGTDSIPEQPEPPEVTAYETWRTANNITDDFADDDRDQIVNVLEYALATNPKRPDALPLEVFIDDGYLVIEHPQRPGLEQVSLTLYLAGASLDDWSEADRDFERSLSAPNRVRYRSRTPVGSNTPWQYTRVQAVLTPAE